jgi:hypothetical protein
LAVDSTVRYTIIVNGISFINKISEGTKGQENIQVVFKLFKMAAYMLAIMGLDLCSLYSVS